MTPGDAPSRSPSACPQASSRPSRCRITHIPTAAQRIIFKCERECLEAAHLHIQLRCPVLVQDRWYAHEWPTCLCHNHNRYCAADARLQLLHAQVPEQDRENILRSRTFRNVANELTATRRMPFLCAMRR